jgi:hypothetical protein
MASEGELGPVVKSYGRTSGQNVGVGCLALVFLALPVGALADASSPFGYVVAGVLVLVVGGAIVLMFRQVLVNWNVRWALHANGFSRTRSGRGVHHPFIDVTAIRFRPAREALVSLSDGTQVLVEGFVGSDEFCARLDEGVGAAMLPTYERRLAAEGQVVLGPLTFTPSELVVGELRIPWRDVAFQVTEVTREVHGNTSIEWNFSRRGETGTVDVPMGEVPFPALARTLIQRGCAAAGAPG